jgi:hypothetical protein
MKSPKRNQEKDERHNGLKIDVKRTNKRASSREDYTFLAGIWFRTFAP